MVLGALGHHPTRCGGTGRALSQQQRDPKPGNKALDKANVREENGGNTHEMEGVEPHNCVCQNNYMYVCIYIYM